MTNAKHVVGIPRSRAYDHKCVCHNRVVRGHVCAVLRRLEAIRAANLEVQGLQRYRQGGVERKV